MWPPRRGLREDLGRRHYGPQGADRVSGGAGRDAINVAPAGRRAHVSCGAGRDTLRLNASERRTVRGCERMLVLPDKRLKRRK
jgi:hypothetical protein